MPDHRIRQQVALLAARLMYSREESEYYTAKRKAARQLGLGPRTRPADLPSNAEVRDQVLALARLYERDGRLDRLRSMRFRALRLMRALARFRPRLIGSVLTGHIREGSDIDIHVFSDGIAAVVDVLEGLGLQAEVERKRVVKHNEARTFTHIRVVDDEPIELTLYPESQVNYVFKSSITGKGMERASIAELEALLLDEEPDLDLDALDESAIEDDDRFGLYRTLLRPLEQVMQSPRHHPEGDALYHSLQVFELARDARPFDEEFLLAALLHDVGKAIDPGDHVGAALAALEGAVSERTAWLIAHHMEAIAYNAGTLGARAKTRLARSEDFDDLMLLRDLDDAGRVPGAEVGSIDEALEFLQSLDPVEDEEPDHPPFN